MTIGMIGGKFLPLHLGHVYAIQQASSQVDKLYVVLSSSELRDRAICKKSNIKYMDNILRMSWLGEVFAKSPNIILVNRVDQYSDYDYNWSLESEEIKKLIPEEITHVFSSEENYTEYFSTGYPKAKHIVIDNNRSLIPISATGIRSNPLDNWKFLPLPVQKYFTKKVCIVGTESCGKTVLSNKLTSILNTRSVLETGIDYCLKYKNELTNDSFDLIAMEHYLNQDKALSNSNKVLIVDSDAIITKYYAEMYLSYKSDIIESIIKKQKYDLVLYLEPDIPWVDDGLRFAGEDEIRLSNNNKLKEMYLSYGSNIVIVSGNYEKRLTKALKEINNCIRS